MQRQAIDTVNGYEPERSRTVFMIKLKAKAWIKFTLCAGILAAASSAVCPGQDFSNEFEAKIDSLIVEAYRVATEKFPCKIKAKGNPRMVNWKDVGKCLNGANDRVDWGTLSRRIEELRVKEGLLREDSYEAVESALSKYAVPYSKVFKVNKEDALLPLSNSLLKFLPADSLKDLPVFDKKLKKRIGTFFESFPYEKQGGLTASNTYKLYLFQYTDLKGDLQSPISKGRLLYDAYGVPWKDASSRIGFRLTADSIGLKY